MLWRGLREPIGSWNTTWTWRRNLFSSSPLRRAGSRPEIETFPEYGLTRPSSARPRVVFPQPDSPAMQKTSPGPTSKETPSTARTSPSEPPKSRREANRTCRSHTSSPAAWPRVPSAIKPSPLRRRGGRQQGASRAFPEPGLSCRRARRRQDSGDGKRSPEVLPPGRAGRLGAQQRSEEHTSELQSPDHLVCRLLLEKKKKKNKTIDIYKRKKKRKTIN